MAGGCEVLQTTKQNPSTPPPAVFSELCSRPVSGLASWLIDRVYRLPMNHHSGLLIHFACLPLRGQHRHQGKPLPVSRLTKLKIA